MPSADDATDRWQVALPTGSEGPYTAGELRDLVCAGRVRPDDHLICLADQRTCTVVDVVPDARRLAVGTDRVRRRSGSDRHAAAKPGTGSEIRRFRTPLPGMPAEHVDALPVPADPPVAAEAPAVRVGPPRVTWLALSMALLLATFAAVMLVWSPSGAGDPGLQPYGAWTVRLDGTHPGPWLVQCDERNIAITGPDGVRFEADAVLEATDLHHVRVVLTKPHPELGDGLAFAGSGTVILSTAAGSGVAHREP